MDLPLEDDFNDIVSKAQKGLGVSTETVSNETGVSENTIRGLRKGQYAADALEKVAYNLRLRVEPLHKIAKGEWQPNKIACIEGFQQISTPFYNTQVNSFLVWDLATRRAIGFDTGTTAEPTLAFLETNSLELEAVMLTHLHHDHTKGLAALKQRFEGVEVFVGEKERIALNGARSIEEGFTRSFGETCTIRAFATTGHTSGGLSYLIHGLSAPIVVVGDALFAGSMGGAGGSYSDSLEAVGRILDLPPETVVAPGHGPMTTVGEQRLMNPFFQA